ncbi:hypothetical protein ID866_4929 [Astraeus odoratus]|nr:hypothetical protein ID866_4929 [Astraeus odoratus]
MATPVASSSQPAQIPALQATHASDTKKPKEKKDKAAAAASQYPLELQPRPDYMEHRIKMFEQLQIEYEEYVKGASPTDCLRSSHVLTAFSAQPREEIVITMPDGSQRQGTSWETSPMDVAKELSKSLSERVVIAKVHVPFCQTPSSDKGNAHWQVNDGLWDLDRPLEGSCKLELLDFEHPEGSI